MCLAIPGKVIDTYEQDGLKMARVDFDGVIRSVCTAYAPTALVGSFVLVHVGFAIALIDEEEAKRTYEMLKAADGDSELPEKIES